MHAEEIRRHLDTKPFLPLRFHVSDGSAYEVRDRSLAYVSRRELIIGIEVGPNEIPRRSVYLDPIHVTRIEPIVNGEGSSQNGAR
jgi:hypothetical protein